MVLDIKLFRKDQGGNPELIRESQRRRHKPVEVVDEIIALDERWRQEQFNVDKKKGELRAVSKQVGEKKKARQECQDLVDASKALKEEIEKLEREIENTRTEIDRKLSTIGNIVHESVPVSNDEDNNSLVRKWGEFNVKAGANKHHHELLHMIDGYDPERGVKVAGHRGYFLKGMGVRLNQAIINYGIAFLGNRDYTALSTPFFMNKESMAKTAQLEQFDEELYKVTGEGVEEKYLIATSEQPISAYHADEWLNPKDLPLRYAGISSCFRKEAGAHGKDTWGIFRVHQFDKVEQFCVTTPEKSWEEHENMLKTSELFYQSLGIPYRVVAIVSGALNNAAAKKYDLEGWFPAFSEFRELVSCSNCTDYQSRSLEVRCGSKQKGDKEKKYVHMLNCTLAATTRVICTILENYQTETGIVVPEALRPFMGGLELIPFTKPCPETPKEAAPKKPAEKKPAAVQKDAAATTTTTTTST
eukprot:TRINITY_DN150_c0_g1_i2.p1 TRINITY_DN150_c0_g1~~TRINITY_DN150_c0_g1_i2.p1  ORF type:complete len:473 (-),score=143.94 TRINITY_DN150_c0_g1_i2:57-1475(-)